MARLGLPYNFEERSDLERVLSKFLNKELDGN